MKMWLNHQYLKAAVYPNFFSQIVLESISEHVTTKIFWGSAPRPHLLGRMRRAHW